MILNRMLCVNSPYVCFHEELDRMKLTQNPHNETLKRALAIIDPESLLDERTMEHRIVRDHVVGLIERLGPLRALEEIEASKKHLQGQIYQMVM